MPQKRTNIRQINFFLFKLITLVFLAFVSMVLLKNLGIRTTEQYAQKMIGKCKTVEDKFSCYDKEIPRLLKNMSMEKVFEVTKNIQEKDSSYVYCHVLGHEIASIETKKNPDKWKEVAARCPAGVCSNGCIHGAFQEKFRDELITDEKLPEIKKDLGEVCEAREGFNPSDLEQASCYHALGHLFMYITFADTDKGVALCDELALKKDGRDFRPVCYDGVFMQIFQPLEREDEVLVYGKVPKREELQNYCFKYTDEARYSCWNESWPMVLGSLPSGDSLNSFCSKLDKKGQDACFTDIFYILPIGLDFNFSKMNEYCANFPIIPKRKVCFSTFVSRILEIDYKNKKKAVDFCLNAPATLKEGCLRDLAMYANFVFHPESQEVGELCSYYPEDLKNLCQI